MEKKKKIIKKLQFVKNEENIIIIKITFYFFYLNL